MRGQRPSRAVSARTRPRVASGQWLVAAPGFPAPGSWFQVPGSRLHVPGSRVARRQSPVARRCCLVPRAKCLRAASAARPARSSPFTLKGSSSTLLGHFPDSRSRQLAVRRSGKGNKKNLHEIPFSCGVPPCLNAAPPSAGGSRAGVPALAGPLSAGDSAGPSGLGVWGVGDPGLRRARARLRPSMSKGGPSSAVWIRLCGPASRCGSSFYQRVNARLWYWRPRWRILGSWGRCPKGRCGATGPSPHHGVGTSWPCRFFSLNNRCCCCGGALRLAPCDCGEPG